jgi:hypothetical protein
MRAASNLGQFNTSAQSNQQDLIDEIEANRQQKRASGERLLPAASANLTWFGSDDHWDECLGILNEGIAAWAV